MQENENRKTIDIAKALAEHIAESDFGTIIHHQEIENITGRKRGTSLYYNAISKAKVLLEEKGKAIQPIGGGDYQILYPGDYSSAYARQVKLANKRIKRGGHILEGAPLQHMTSEERSAFNNVYDFHKRLESRLAGEYVEVEQLAVPKKHPFAVAAENPT